MEENPRASKGEKGGNLVFIIIGAAVLLVVTIGSTFFLSSKIEDSNQRIVVVNEDSKIRDGELNKKIDNVDDSVKAIIEKMVEMEKSLNGKIWYLQDQVNKNKRAVEDLNSSVEELKVQPVAVVDESVDEPVQKISKKKKRSSGFDFSELESMGEEFETMFE